MRDLTDIARGRDRHLAARIDAAEQGVGNRGPLLLAGIPCFEDRIGFLSHRGVAGRAAIDEHRDHRLAEGLHRREQLILLTHQIKAGAIAEMPRCPAFTAGLFGVADEEQDDIGILCDFDSFGDAAAVFFGIAKFDLVFPPVVVSLRDFDAERVDDICLVTDKIANSLKRGHARARFAIVTTQSGNIGVGSDNRDGRLCCASPFGQGERQDTVILEQDQRLFGGLASQRHTFCAVRRHRLLKIGPWIVEQSGVELHGQETAHCGVDLIHRNAALVHALHEVFEACALRQVDIDTRFQSQFGGGGIIGHDLVQAGEVFDRVIIGDDGAFVIPFAAQHVIQQPAVRVRRDTVDLVVACHDGVDCGARHHLFERREEHFAQGALADLGRADIGAAFGLAMARHVLESGHDLAIFQLPIGAHAGQALDRGYAHLSDKIGVFAKCLLDPAPARIARDVDNRREDQMDAARAHFARDEIVDFADEISVPCAGEAD